MPKKDKKAAKKDKGRDPADVVDAVRGAVERTFQATTGGTEGARDRGRSLLDDVASAAQRIRESFDDLRVLEDVRGLRAEIEALSKRVAELEKQKAKPAAPASAAAKPAPARRAPAKPRASAAKPTAAKPAAAKPAAAKPTAAKAKPSAARTAAKTTGPKAKPAASRRKPAATTRSTPSGTS
jgi:cell division septum initiation protein DivIVA